VKTSPDPPLVGVISLGCPKALVDSEQLMGRLAEAGCIVCEDLDDADVLIVTTCGFIQEAKEESLDVVFRCAEQKRQGHLEKLIVTGCLAERYQDELARELHEVDAVVGLHSEDEIVKLCLGRDPGLPVCDVPARLRLTARHVAYLRIADGCDNRCAYCAIPDIRGPFHSIPMERLLDEASQLADDGARELCVIAQDTTLYGTDLYGRPRLHELLQGLAEISGVEWVRLLYTHPAHYYPELIESLAAGGKLLPYVDLPVQHASDRILADMGRRVTQAELRSLVAELRQALPGCFIRTTAMVGFPGETESEFEELLHFVRDMRFERLGAFTYSPEDGTPAEHFPDQVPESVRDERLDAIMAAQQQIAFEFNASLVGQELPCVIDGPAEEPHEWLGRTWGDAPEVDGCIYAKNSGLAPGDFVTLRVTGARDYDLVGEVVPS